MQEAAGRLFFAPARPYLAGVVSLAGRARPSPVASERAADLVLSVASLSRPVRAVHDEGDRDDLALAARAVLELEEPRESAHALHGPGLSAEAGALREGAQTR